MSDNGADEAITQMMVQAIVEQRVFDNRHETIKHRAVELGHVVGASMTYSTMSEIHGRPLVFLVWFITPNIPQDVWLDHLARVKQGLAEQLEGPIEIHANQTVEGQRAVSLSFPAVQLLG